MYRNIYDRVHYLIFFLLGFNIAMANNPVPFSTDSNSLTIWNGDKYEPFFIKGTNLGIAKPGTYPGEMLATRDQYKSWFAEIKEAGFNCIRLYTLHFPHFYEELLNYNTQNPQQPLLFFQGVWLNEELDGYKNDLYLLTDTFKAEIRENIDCLHGNKNILQRYGKAYGTYTADVSKWNLGYIIGREIYPNEIITTNEMHPNDNSFKGNAFSIENASASEKWVTENLDHIVIYERTKYNTQRPVSSSSWPTLDPILHPLEPNRLEDTISVDLSKIKIVDAPAGLFMSYHVYPYYPDFVGADPKYKTYSDKYGPNSYLGYLTDLKSHYKNYPLLIAEFGVPSSWGIAHYTSSGMNHGGFDELEQGETDLRLLSSINSANLAGGIQFAWIDEWFKSTWITDPVDFGDKILWHNITAAEQNFGLKRFVNKKDWEVIKDYGNREIKKLSAKAGFDFFEIKLDLKNKMNLLGDCWIALDTYDANLGESMLPNGMTVNSRAEFILHITQYSAQLYVTQAYDLFGLWHKQTTLLQKHQSTVTDGAPWQIVRWKNNSGYSDVQYIGELKLNKSFQPESSKDAVTIYDDKIQIRLPWTLLNVVDPSKKWVYHDNKTTQEPEKRISDGIVMTIFYMDDIFTQENRYVWNDWNKVIDSDVVETKKSAYWVLYNHLIEYNTSAIVFPDHYTMTDSAGSILKVNAENGVMNNDFDIDSKNLFAVLTDAPTNGFVELQTDGSFIYIPRKGFEGTDRFKYAILDEKNLSTSNTVSIKVNKQGSSYYKGSPHLFKVFPNPTKDSFTLKSEVDIISIKLTDASGKIFREELINAKSKVIDVSNLKPGLYFVITNIGGYYFSEKLIIIY